MSKRKVEHRNPCAPLSIASFDAALDMLACDTFTKLDTLGQKFEAAAGIKLNDGIVRTRWDEAVTRYWVMKSMDGLCCSANTVNRGRTDVEQDGEVEMGEEEDKGEGSSHTSDTYHRPMPHAVYPGAPIKHSLNSDEEAEWRRWSPKIHDVVLVDLPDEKGLWPGKVIDKRLFFQGRTVPRGNHFFAVRIYSEDMEPVVTVRSRMIPLRLRPDPPLLAREPVISAFNHAQNPTTFDMKASARESLAAHNRTHRGVLEDGDSQRIEEEKESWKAMVNWVLNERRVEKLRAVEEERRKRLLEVAKNDFEIATTGEASGEEGDACLKKRKKITTVPLPPTDSPACETRSNSPAGCGIFGPTSMKTVTTPRRTSSPSLANLIRPLLSTPQRPSSPLRFDKKRSVYSGIGEYSPKGRGTTYTPSRILPSGDETAPQLSSSPAPSLQNFDFVSPLGPVRLGRLSSAEEPRLMRKGSLEVVKEEQAEAEGDGWTVVNRRDRRAGTAPCRDKGEMRNEETGEGMKVDL